jgi:hypothetical protein
MELKKVKAIVLKEWDPLDVGDNPHLSDEYDAYLPELIRLLKAGCTSHEVAEHLKAIEDKLGVTLPSERRKRAAALLVKE